MKTTALQDHLISDITRYYPFTADEVKKVWEEVNRSYDDTIKILEHSVSLGCEPEHILSVISRFKN